MKSIPVLRVVSALLFSFTLAGCRTGSSDSPDGRLARELWGEIEGYKDWADYPDWEGWQESDSVHGNYVKIYINDVAAKNHKTLPPGSILVKEGFKKQSDDTLRAITVMKRIEGYNAEYADWLSVGYKQSGAISRINKGCVKCHGDAEGDDLVFINDF